MRWYKILYIAGLILMAVIKSFCAYTNEIDDVDVAVSEIVENLDFEGRLLRNSIGIVSCFTEFIDSGVVKALTERLPFDIVGMTTAAGSTCGELGEDMLSLIVLTSDEVEFVTALTDPIEGSDASPLRRAYETATESRPHQLKKPAMMLSFVPLLFNLSGDFFADNMDEITGGVPNFGAIAVDHNPDYRDSQVIFNGEAYPDRYAFVLIYGDISPKFYIGTISDESIFPDKGVITASNGNHLQSVNDIPITDYLLSIGLSMGADGKSIAGINAFPIILDLGDGTKPILRAMFAVTPDGGAVCGGRIPAGVTMGIGRFDPDEIAVTAADTMKKACSGEHSTMIVFSCVGRYMALLYERFAELESVVSETGKAGLPYVASYSGGEICPVYRADGSTVNRAHNNTFVICAF